MSESPKTIKLLVSGQVPSFKNRKRIGKRCLYTDPKVKARMEQIIHNIQSQLRGLFPTEEGAMRGVCQKPSQTASFLPVDDSWAQMIPGRQSVRLVPKGQEGCEITLTRIEPS